MAADIMPLFANNFILFMIVNFTLYVECRVQYLVHALLPRYGLYTLLSDILSALCTFRYFAIDYQRLLACRQLPKPYALPVHTMHQRVMPGFIKLVYAKVRHLHHASQTFVLREIENHVTGGRNDSTSDCFFYLP